MGGFEAGLAALLVAVKQLIPDNEVALLGGALKFRAKVTPRPDAAPFRARPVPPAGRVAPRSLLACWLLHTECKGASMTQSD